MRGGEAAFCREIGDRPCLFKPSCGVFFFLKKGNEKKNRENEYFDLDSVI